MYWGVVMYLCLHLARRVSTRRVARLISWRHRSARRPLKAWSVSRTLFNLAWHWGVHLQMKWRSVWHSAVAPLKVVALLILCFILNLYFVFLFWLWSPPTRSQLLDFLIAQGSDVWSHAGHVMRLLPGNHLSCEMLLDRDVGSEPIQHLTS